MIIAEYGLAQLIREPTRVTENSSTLIDLLSSSEVDVFQYVGCEELGLSDHCLIYGRLKTIMESKQHVYWDVRCLGKCDVDRLNADLDTAPWQVMDSLDDVDSQWDFWKKMFWDIVDSHAPTKRARVRRKCPPWIDREIRILMRARSYYHKKAKKSMQETRGLGNFQVH